MPHEASAILGIPLSCRCPPDKIAWAYSPLGLFTTSSAYKLLVSGDAVSQAGSSNVDTQKHFWKGVWRLRVPNKIKHFIWRVPPTPEFLRLTLSVFADSGRLQKGGVCYISLVLVESEKRYPFWPTGAPSAHIISLAGNLLQDFLAIQELDPVVACSPILQQWRPPELNQHKVNFDAAIFRATNSAGIGVVVKRLER